MSQAKVDQYKKEKYERKHSKKKTNFKKITAYVVATVIALLFVVYMGWSVVVSTGLYEPKTTMSAEELESLRDVLRSKNDEYVPTTAAEESATVLETTTVAK